MTKKTIELFLPAKDFRKRLLKLKPFMADAGTRPCLEGVYFKYNQDTLILCATNGHMLCEMTLHLNEKSSWQGKFACIISRTDILDIASMLVGAREHEILKIEAPDNPKHRPHQVVFTFREEGYIATTCAESYPNYQRVIPLDTYVMREGINAKYVLDTLKALGNAPVDMSVAKGLSPEEQAKAPHLFTSDHIKGIRCVVMPIKLGGWV